MIYLDNAATTRPSQAVMDAVRENWELYSNPASLHDFGLDAEKALEGAREILAKSMGIDPECFYFTSGGTMSDNIAVRGYLQTKRKGRIITSAFEHPAVAECFKSLEGAFEVVYIKPENGIITAEAVERELTADTVFVSIMQVNNETGAKNDILGIAQLLREEGIVFHTDAVQGYLKEPFTYSKVDMASFSAHKTHGLKGIGGLYVKKGLRPKPMIYGGGQEGNIHSGTVNVMGAVAWAAAVEDILKTATEDRKRIEEINSRYREVVTALGGKILTPEISSPYILSVAFEGYLGENILHYLSERGIHISTGSACSSKKVSPVMRALGYENLQKSVLRFSFSAENTIEEVDVVATELKNALNEVIKYN